MQLRANIKVVAEITVNDTEAEVLEHLCSYGLAKVFAEKFSKKYTAEQIEATLRSICTQARVIIEARDAAVEAVHGVKTRGAS